MSTALPRPWLAHYPPGVPAEIDLSDAGTLVDLLDDGLRRHAARPAAVFLGESSGFDHLDREAEALTVWLQRHGVVPGTRVALMMPNLPQYMVAITAVLRAGGIVVNVNPLYTPRELEHQLRDAGAEVIVLLENFAATLQQVIERTAVRHVLLTSTGDMLPAWKGRLIDFAVRHVRKMVPAFELPLEDGRSVSRWRPALRSARGQHRSPVQVRPDDIAFLQYTGGTTGVSKGAVLLHRHVVANVRQCEAWFSPQFRSFGAQQLTGVCALPLYHIFALTLSFFFGVRMGVRLILIPNPRDLKALVGALRGQRFHMFPAVNTLFNALAHDPAFARLDFSALVVSNGGGMAVQQATAEKWLQVTGCPVAEGYGLSETSPVATANRLDLKTFTGTIGLPVPSTDITIRDDEGRDLPFGQAGEICIRGPQVMAGYWQRPDETAKVMSADGFFRSGDIGVMSPDGQVRIVDRKKDMILVSGFNVYPTEIEQVVSQHPGVLECAAFGVPDAHSGEAVRLCVVRSDPALSETEIAEHCRRHLTAYKCPRQIEFRDELPKSNVGKILRRELRDSARSTAP
ncbi:MAG: hypothetical protein RL489_3137 [Pseudomonadota bacterium]|jgi:long-chain acyl-CoA synthetase